MNVRIELKHRSMEVRGVPSTSVEYDVINAETGQAVGRAANALNLGLQCRAHGWTVINPPKRWRITEGIQ